MIWIGAISLILLVLVFAAISAAINYFQNKRRDKEINVLKLNNERLVIRVVQLEEFTGDILHNIVKIKEYLGDGPEIAAAMWGEEEDF